MEKPGPAPTARQIGRYMLFGEVAHGGMATVHLGRLRGPAGFARNVAIKRLHPQFARDPEFVAMFLDEARLAARIQHPNVVAVHDVIAAEGELFLVMDYVHGDALSKLLRRAKRMDVVPPIRILSTIVGSILDGLHAAHEARSDRGEPLEIVHRDVSPQNILVGVDGVARVLDFGVAKAAWRLHEGTRDGAIKGKLAYMAPEQWTKAPVDRRADVFTASIVLWEALSGERLFFAPEPETIVSNLLTLVIPSPSLHRPEIPPALEAVVMRGLSRNLEDRFATAHDMAVALEAAMPPASPREVGEWVSRVSKKELAARAQAIAATELITFARPLSVPAPPLVANEDSDSGVLSAIDANLLVANDEPTDLLNAPVAKRRASMTDETLAGDVSTDAVIGVALGPSKKSQRRQRVGVALALFGFVLALLLFVRWKTTGAEEAPKETAARVQSVKEPALPAIPPPAAPPLASVAPTTSVAARVTPQVAVHEVAPHAVTTKKPAPAPVSNCNPPFTIDPQGVRILKRECM